MSRNLDSTFAASLSDGLISPCILAMLTFKSQTVYCWSGVGPLAWDGFTFTGTGSLGQIGEITEATAVQADGTTVSLSGIDPLLLSECLTDVQVGAPAQLWFGNYSNGGFVGEPYSIFQGTIDQPSFSLVPDTSQPGVITATITLALENKMVDLSRPRMYRYTAADQHVKFPLDIAFNWVEVLNDAAFRWG